MTETFRTIIISTEHYDMACAIAQAIAPASSYFDGSVINQEDGPVFAKILSGYIDTTLAQAFDSVVGCLDAISQHSLTYSESQVEHMLEGNGVGPRGELLSDGTLNGSVVDTDTDVWASALDPRGWWIM